MLLPSFSGLRGLMGGGCVIVALVFVLWTFGVVLGNIEVSVLVIVVVVVVVVVVVLLLIM